MACSRCPRIVVAGAHSGVGKTSLTLALVAALRQRGLRVQTFKVGPDFLDPTYLTAASGRTCYNLDSWMGDAAYVKQLFVRTTGDADIAVIEGVMGLFDGASPNSIEGSTAEIARILNAPVLLIVNAHGMARSIAALTRGYAGFEPGVTIAGVVANMTGGEGHRKILVQALESAEAPPLLGCVPRGAIPSLPSRHLGLVTADPRRIRGEIVEACGSAAEQYLDLDYIRSVAESAPQIAVAAQRGEIVEQKPTKIAVAWDEAFHFYYRDFLDGLETRGCELHWFSPLRDRVLPEECAGVYLGGGYPEEFAEELSANNSMLQSIRRYAESGKMVYAECGGLMYLTEQISDREGNEFPMVGLLPVGTRMLSRRKALGYVSVHPVKNTVVGGTGEKLRGHEFHYSECTADPEGVAGWTTAYQCTQRRNGRAFREGYSRNGILASYIHLYPGPHEKSIQRFVNECNKHMECDCWRSVPSVTGRKYHGRKNGK